MQGIFCSYRILVAVLFFRHLKNIFATSLGFCGSWWDTHCHYCFPSVGKMLFFSGCFQDCFFVNTSFQKSEYHVFGVNFCGFSLFRVPVISHYSLNSSSAHPLFPFSLGLQWHAYQVFCSSTGPWCPVHFFPTYFLFFNWVISMILSSSSLIIVSVPFLLLNSYTKLFICFCILQF